MTIENEHFEEIEIEELTADEALSVFGADPDYHAYLDDYQSNPEPVDADHDTPVTRLMEI